jgi:hypothetical protein
MTLICILRSRELQLVAAKRWALFAFEYYFLEAKLGLTGQIWLVFGGLKARMDKHRWKGGFVSPKVKAK